MFDRLFTLLTLGNLFTREGPLGIFVKGWYFFLMPIAAGCFYKIYTILEQNGKIDQFQAFLKTHILGIQTAVDKCAPLLVESFQKFMDCI
jgi:hypothetical protein